MSSSPAPSDRHDDVAAQGREYGHFERVDDTTTRWVAAREEHEASTLDEILRAYLRSKGFHPTASDGSDEYGWGHPELGEGRTFMQCVEWQIGREQAASDEIAGLREQVNKGRLSRERAEGLPEGTLPRV